MENRVADKLVIVSRKHYGKELPLLSGRTTIGSAPDNDIQLEDEDIAGFHAQLQIEKETFILTDFDTAGGTFLNGERVKQESSISAGDMIRIGATQAVFLPSNSILVKANSHKEAHKGGKELFQGISPTIKKVIAGCLVVLLIVLAKMILRPGTEPTDQNQTVALNQKEPENPAGPAGGEAAQTNDNNIKTDSRAAESPPSQSTDGIVKNETASPTQAISVKKDVWPKSAAEIYFKTAGQFADYRLWSPALENYYKVSDLNPDYPNLSEEVERMQFEIKNQAVFEAGVGLIRSMQYEKGIARLTTIAEESVYFEDAAQKIAMAESKLADEKKEIAAAEKRYPVKKSLKSATKKTITHSNVLKLALDEYIKGNIQTALQKLEQVLQTVDSKNHEDASQAEELKKQIKLAEILYRKGAKEYSTGQALAAISTWSQFFEADRKLAPEKNSFFYQSAVRKMAEEYSQRALKAYSNGDLRTAYLLSARALNIKSDDPQSMIVKKKLVKKSKQLYEEGYILEEYDYEKAMEKYREIFKICDEETVYYKKALARVGRK